MSHIHKQINIYVYKYIDIRRTQKHNKSRARKSFRSLLDQTQTHRETYILCVCVLCVCELLFNIKFNVLHDVLALCVCVYLWYTESSWSCCCCCYGGVYAISLLHSQKEARPSFDNISIFLCVFLTASPGCLLLHIYVYICVWVGAFAVLLVQNFSRFYFLAELSGNYK